MRVKMFGSIGLTGYFKPRHHHELEDEVNSWLEQNPTIKVIDIKQSASGGSFARPQFFITIVYEPAR
jgi:hypothetical protein